jgi:hypothetical protein
VTAFQAFASVRKSTSIASTIEQCYYGGDGWKLDPSTGAARSLSPIILKYCNYQHSTARDHTD